VELFLIEKNNFRLPLEQIHQPDTSRNLLTSNQQMNLGSSSMEMNAERSQVILLESQFQEMINFSQQDIEQSNSGYLSSEIDEDESIDMSSTPGELQFTQHDTAVDWDRIANRHEEVLKIWERMVSEMNYREEDITYSDI
jgi:hypothetical protein